jgi:uncharacterized protein with von Willebrand factor type A (vWA) domain
MADGQVYLEKLSAFSKLLHLEGLSVSPQETADACRVLLELGMEDREQVRVALRTVYAKSREEQVNFDRVFDGFFLPEEVIRARNEYLASEVRRQQQHADEELRLNGQPMEFTQEQRLAYGSLSEEERQRLQNILEKYGENAARNPGLYDNFIHSIFSRSIMEQQMRMEDAGMGGMETDPELGLLYRDISAFSDSEIPKAITLIQRVTRTINGELSAKRTKKGRSSKLDFRRTIRKGLETGGSFYKLKYRRKRSRRKQLVLLCDVSGSMVQFSEFALRFIQSLNQASESSRVFLFSEKLHEADPFCLQNMDRFRSYVRETGLYGRGTDLANALEKLNAMKPGALNPATTLLILSDTKTTGQKRALRALQESKRLAGQVIILNPIPERKWKYLQSAQNFAAAANMISCATLRDLAAACRKLVVN